MRFIVLDPNWSNLSSHETLGVSNYFPRESNVLQPLHLTFGQCNPSQLTCPCGHGGAIVRLGLLALSLHDRLFVSQCPACIEWEPLQFSPLCLRCSTSLA
jgi:hypothetical protein